MAYSVSSALDQDSIRTSFEEHGYVHIPGILPLENANRILKALLEQTPWTFVFNDGKKHVDMPANYLSSLQNADINRLQKAIFNQARSGFQYSYHNYPVYDAVQAGENQGHVLHGFYEWLNADEFLEFARTITGSDCIDFVDAQATRYGPGHFLTSHDDIQAGKNRQAAYIFNFTPSWRADWGGILQLWDDDGNVRMGLRPTFNALNILAIPQEHSVSFVTPFAGGYRFSVSGWFRSGTANGCRTSQLADQ